jgi:hypothetical protein
MPLKKLAKIFLPSAELNVSKASLGQVNLFEIFLRDQHFAIEEIKDLEAYNDILTMETVESVLLVVYYLGYGCFTKETYNLCGLEIT